MNNNKLLAVTWTLMSVVLLSNQALANNTTNASPTANNALASITTGQYNTAMGNASLYANTTGDFNSGYGASSLTNNISGGGNTGIGMSSLMNNTTGSENTAVGFNSMYSNTTGQNNTAIGNGAGHNNTTGSNNVFIGNSAGYNETGSNKLYIDNSDTAKPLIYGDFSKDHLVVNGNLTVTGETNFKGSVNVPDPKSPSHAATKRYVDSIGAMSMAMSTATSPHGSGNHFGLGVGQIGGQHAVAVGTGIAKKEIKYSLSAAHNTSMSTSAFSAGVAFKF